MSSISTPYYKALDFTLIFLACSVSYWVRFDTLALPLYYFLPTVIFALVSTLSLGITNFYQEVNSDSSPRQAVAAIGGLTVSTMITIACLYLTKTGEDYSRVWLMTSFGFAFFALLTARVILRRVFHVSNSHRAIVLLGANRTAQAIKATIESQARDGISIAAHFDPLQLDSSETENVLVRVAEYIEAHRKNIALKSPVTEVWVTYDAFTKFSHIELAAAFDDSSVTLVYIPEIPELDIENAEPIQVIAGIPTINSGFSKDNKLRQLLKFIEDQSIAWISLLILSPAMIIIAILIKLDSSGPVFFKQVRYGFGGKSFMIWKFRTMYVDCGNTEFKQAQKNDPRVTKVGRFIRKTSLDELPQLINVITGSMSIVGPRPHPEQLNEQYRRDITQYMYRHALKPGITGLAQIKGFRGETVDPSLMELRVKYDLEYIRSWSILLDFKILIMTVWHIATTDKAH